jgi:hypothetical protein
VQLFANLTLQGLDFGLAFFYLAARKFPFLRDIRIFRRPTLNAKDFVIVDNNGGNNRDVLHFQISSASKIVKAFKMARDQWKK